MATYNRLVHCPHCGAKNRRTLRARLFPAPGVAGAAPAPRGKRGGFCGSCGYDLRLAKPTPPGAPVVGTPAPRDDRWAWAIAAIAAAILFGWLLFGRGCSIPAIVPVTVAAADAGVSNADAGTIPIPVVIVTPDAGTAPTTVPAVASSVSSARNCVGLDGKVIEIEVEAPTNKDPDRVIDKKLVDGTIACDIAVARQVAEEAARCPAGDDICKRLIESVGKAR